MIFRRRILWAIAILLAGAVAYAVYFSYATKETQPLMRSGAGLEWLRRAYALTEQDMEPIRRAHRDYLPQCQAMCAELATARKEMRKVFAEGGDIQRLKAAHAEVSHCEQRCIEMSLDHMERVAGLLPPEKSDTFRRKVLEQLLGLSGEHHHIFETAGDAGGGSMPSHENGDRSP